MTSRSLLVSWLVLLLGLAAGPARAQTPAFGLLEASVAKVVLGTDTLTQPWAGGLNTPQFSTIDLNGDGQLDLYAFDRESARSYTFLNVAKTGGGRRYQYAPEYVALFPRDLVAWVLLRDYDCDGRADLFTIVNGGYIRAFHNVASGGRPTFVPADTLKFPVGIYQATINTGYYNLPSITDVNGDGRLDILTYDFIGSTLLEMYINTSSGSCGGISSFNRVTNYWGQIQSCYDCGSYQLQGAATCSSYRTDHTLGHNILLIDLNGDGKLDLLDGRDNCPVLTRLLNSGASSTISLLAPAGVSSAFPAAGAPVNLPVFPAPYQLDADFDGVPDLVMAPNMINNDADHVSLRNSVRLYHNAAASASAVPSFTLTNSSFLQQDMLDVSEGAAPTFGDLDGDGLVDMLIGNQADLVNGTYRASLSYYRNVGTTHRPVYRLLNDDYLGLAATAVAARTPLTTLRPTLVDLNRDGALDLVYSAYNGTTGHLYYLLNAAPAGQPASFTPSQVSYFSIPGTTPITGLPDEAGDTPCFFDVDGDGYVDLLLGTNQYDSPTTTPGSLRYFHNRTTVTGSNLDNLFTLANPDYGQLRNGLNRPPSLSPAIADFDGDGTPDLLTIDGTGTVTLYANFRSQAGGFIGRTDLFYSTLTGQFTPALLGRGLVLRFAAVAADLNQDNTPELYIGTESGGMVSFLPRPTTALAVQPVSAAAALAFSLFPNPAAQAATAETAQPTRLRLFDLTGRQVLADATLARTHQLDLRGLAAGIYIAQATAADGTATTQRLAVRE